MAKHASMRIKVQRRIPNFIEHKPEDLIVSYVGGVKEIERIEWVQQMMSQYEDPSIELWENEEDPKWSDWTHDLVLIQEGCSPLWIGYIWHG